MKMKDLGIKDVESFPFPTPPPHAAIVRACSLLSNIGAVADVIKKVRGSSGPGITTVVESAVTNLGKLLTKIPIKYVAIKGFI